MQIEQVIGGVNGDTTAQAVQLRMRSFGQNLVSGARLVAYDAAGANPVVVIDFSSDVTHGSTGDRVLITSANFAPYTSGTLVSDFTMTNPIPASYLAAGRLTYERDTGGILWSVSWGGTNYNSATTGTIDNDADGQFGPSVDGDLPSSDLRALKFQGAATALSSNNQADYALTAAPSAWINNAGQSFTLLNGILIVTNTNDSGVGSLRQAILDANASNDLNTINFNINGAGVHTISPTSALPDITDPVIIDGYTQPGASENTLAIGDDAVLLIELNGMGAAGFVAGLSIATSNCTVRGLVINRFGGAGLSLGSGANNNVIAGNFIGTDSAGTLDVGNGNNGMLIVAASGNTIGGATPADRNVISGNNSNGIFLGGSSSGNMIQGNFIGTTAAGNAALPNGTLGIGILDADHNTVLGNVVSANTVDGVVMSSIDGITTAANVVQGNFIGTDVTGTANLGNGNNGVLVIKAPNTTIGGTTAGDGNVIAHNASNGVLIMASEATRNAVLGNSIAGNGALGIDLGSDGVTTNDVNDADSGPNNLQNFPVLTQARNNPSQGFILKGALDSAANSTYRVEFFSNAACDSSGNGEGETFLGFANVITDATGHGDIDVTLPITVPAISVVTATATDSNNNTSEFSPCVAVTGKPPATHDLAVVKLKAPKKITFSATVTNVVGKFSVTIQNRSNHNETINDMVTLTNLVTVSIQSLSNCPSFFATVLPPKATFPITLASKKKLKLAFLANFDCVNDPLATTSAATHNDFRTVATVTHIAIDGESDVHTADDSCPHDPIGVDPNPDGTIKDKGCGGKKPDGTLGADVFIDVVGP